MKPGKLVFCVGLTLNAVAMADLPPAVDRAPADAAFVISIRQLDTALANIENVVKTFQIPQEEFQIAHLQKMMGTAGVKKDGSAAIAMLSPEKVDGEDAVVVIVPVTEYNGFAKALGGSGGKGLEQVKVDDHDAYIKDIGGGYAAMGPVKAIVEAFKGAPGNSEAHSKMVGAQGRDIANSANAVAFVNFATLRPKLQEGLKEIKDGMAADPTAPKEMTEQMSAMMDSFARDAQAAVVGLTISDAGIRLDSSAQFAEKSEWAGYFSGPKGATSTDLLAKLPSQPYFFAASFDMSSEGMKKIFNSMIDLTQQAAKASGGPDPFEMMGGFDIKGMLQKTDGMSYVLGNTPAIMGAPFINTSSYIKTSDPAAYLKTIKEFNGKLDGKQVEGITYKTSYESGVVEVGGTSVDTWGLQMEPDKDNPQAEMMIQQQAMIFGPDGMGVYLAPATGGVVMTMAKNKEYLEKALKSANGGGGLDGEAGIKGVASQLPAKRSAEMYIGVKTILDTVGSFLPIEIDAPDDMAPIAFAAASGDGGARFTMFMPQAVLNIVSQFANQGNPPMENEGDGTGQPRF